MRVFVLIFLIVCVVQTASAQRAELEITITDQTSAVVPIVTARLLKNNQVVEETTTSKAQKIVFSNIAPDSYLLEIESAGFLNYAEEIAVKTGDNRINVRLEIQQIIENVEVGRSVGAGQTSRRARRSVYQFSEPSGN